MMAMTNINLRVDDNDFTMADDFHLAGDFAMPNIDYTMMMYNFKKANNKGQQQFNIGFHPQQPHNVRH